MFDKNKSALIYIIPVLLIALLAVYFIGKNYGKAKAGAEDSDNLNSQIKPKQLSFPLSTYKDMADTIYTAMVGIGCDFDTIKSNLSKLNTPSDFFQLEKSFGTRDCFTYLWVITPFSGTLIQWFTDQLSTDQKTEISEMLSEKQITLTI